MHIGTEVSRHLKKKWQKRLCGLHVESLTSERGGRTTPGLCIAKSIIPDFLEVEIQLLGTLILAPMYETKPESAKVEGDML